ncbi:HHL186Wp [Eremothecium sinecaudum]|uniref:HHL186Wp n=1 Tax=Eremothecium sinecaudum TaxID=45286 RepID=A0A0X8HW89_9SACH|nr:HHL186Wp [Eremothecium sinecaudum]AMD22584.1 HHL186Wp [Eremothecium sinecaudum]
MAEMTTSSTSLEVPTEPVDDTLKLQQLGIQCISPGLSSENMDNKMLTTMRISKSIAKEQRRQIEKLGTINNVAETSQSVEAPPVNDTVPSQGSSTLMRPRGKSLRRNRMPRPLNIGGTSINNAGPDGLCALAVESAPAHITNYQQALQQQQNRVLKPRVQYMGKQSLRYGAGGRRAGALVHMGYPPLMPMYPYGPQYYPQSSQPQYSAPMYMMMPHLATACPRINSSYGQQFGPHSAVPTAKPRVQTGSANKVQVDFESFLEGTRQNVIPTRDVFANNTSKWAPLKAQPLSAQEEFFGKRSKLSSDPEVDESGPDAEDTALDVPEEDASTTLKNASAQGSETVSANAPTAHVVPGESIRGEITILDDTFAFEFSSIKDKTDKKMFISICDKVWDESKKLNNGTEKDMQ